MRIVANRILTDWEFERMNVPKEYVRSQTKGEITVSAFQKIQEMPGLFTENKQGDLGTEYRFECIVMSREQFKELIDAMLYEGIAKIRIDQIIKGIIKE